MYTLCDHSQFIIHVEQGFYPVIHYEVLRLMAVPIAMFEVEVTS